MNNIADIDEDIYWNSLAIELLETLGIVKPTQRQIDQMELAVLAIKSDIFESQKRVL